MLADVPTHLAARLRAANDDDPVWLVFADWLEAHDDPRAELIRRRQGAPTTLDDEGASRILADVKRRLLDGLETPERVEIQWRDGFVVGLRMRAGPGWRGADLVPFLEGLDARAAVLLTALDASLARIAPAVVPRLVEAPALRHVSRVRLAGDGRSRGWLDTVVDESGWPLRSLSVTASALDGAAMHTLARASGLGMLEHLDLSRNAIGAQAGLLATLPALGSLGLDWNRLGPEGGAALGASGWPRLHTVSVVGNRLDAAGAAALLRGRHATVTSLAVAGNELQGAAGGRAFARALPALEELDLRGNALGDEGIAALVDLDAPRLRKLRLGTTGIGDAGAEALGKAGWPSLTRLELDDNRIGPDGARALGSAGLARLEELDLRSNRLGDAGAAALADLDGLPNLATLWLSRNDIGDGGALALAATAPPRLGMLALETNRIGDRGALALARARAGRPWLRVGLGGNPLSDAGWSALRESGLYELYYRRR